MELKELQKERTQFTLKTKQYDEIFFTYFTVWRNNLLSEINGDKLPEAKELIRNIAKASILKINDIEINHDEVSSNFIKSLDLNLSEDELKLFATEFLKYNDYLLYKYKSIPIFDESLAALDLKKYQTRLPHDESLLNESDPLQKLYKAWILSEEREKKLYEKMYSSIGLGNKKSFISELIKSKKMFDQTYGKYIGFGLLNQNLTDINLYKNLQKVSFEKDLHSNNIKTIIDSQKNISDRVSNLVDIGKSHQLEIFSAIIDSINNISLLLSEISAKADSSEKLSNELIDVNRENFERLISTYNQSSKLQIDEAKKSSKFAVWIATISILLTLGGTVVNIYYSEKTINSTIKTNESNSKTSDIQISELKNINSNILKIIEKIKIINQKL